MVLGAHFQTASAVALNHSFMSFAQDHTAGGKVCPSRRPRKGAILRISMVFSATSQSISAMTRRAYRLVKVALPVFVLICGFAISLYLSNVMRTEIQRTAQERFVH